LIQSEEKFVLISITNNRRRRET